MLSESSAREVQSVRTAFRIVGAIQKRDGATLHELAGQLDVAKSTVHNYLGTLQSLGYVVDRDGTYRLGLRFLTHGMAARNGIEASEAVSVALAAVAEELSQPAWWVVEEFGRGYFVEKSVPGDAAETYGRLGKRSYLHTHAPGKAILASLPEAYLDDVLEFHGLPALTSKTTTSRRELREQLEAVREQGYAVGEGEAALGVQSAGVAFETPDGNVQAIGVFGYSHDFSRNKLEQDVPSVLREAVAEIEHPSGGR
jgi:DNA-binding IclR family transcriptional regulator